MADYGSKYPTSRANTIQTIAYTGTSVGATNAFGGFTTHVRLVSNSDCAYKIGTGAQTAASDNTSLFLPAKWVEYVTVGPGQSIAAIGSGNTSGTMWVVELTS